MSTTPHDVLRTPQSECPSRETLASFLAGRLPDAPRLRIERHLEACRDCAEALRTLDGQADNLIELLQQPITGEEPSPEAIRRMEEAIDDLSRPGRPPTEETPVEDREGANGEAGRFRVLGPHKEGGIGLVLRGLDRSFGREVALKEMRREVAGHPALRDRFLNEAEITARLEHPGIIPVYGRGVDQEGRACYAMRFVRGKTLQEAIAELQRESPRPHAPARVGSLPLRKLLGRFVGVCHTMAYAHSEGAIHRDLKPENILLGPFGETLVVDWGLAKWVKEPERALVEESRDERPCGPGSTPTAPGQALGTPQYMSPEQAEGRLDAVGPASDVYSLGATLYTILTGRPPFPSDDDQAEVIARVKRGEFARPRQVDHSISPELEAICLKAMGLRSEDRYSSAQALADDVERWLADEPVSGLREPWSTWLRRWISRHRASFYSTVAVVSMALFVIGPLVVYFIHRSQVTALERREEARRHAQQAQEEALRHREQLNDMNYANAEKTAGEVLRQGGPGAAVGALAKIREAAAIPTPLRSDLGLRNLAVQAHGAFDLRERRKLTSINSACLAFSRDGRRLAVGEHHRELTLKYRVQVFDVATGSRAAEYLIWGTEPETKRTGVSALAFSPDGRWLAAGLRNGKVLVCDTAGGNPDAPPASLHGGAEAIRGLAFTADGKTLISASREGTVRTWDVGSPWPNRSSSDLDDQIGGMSLSRDGTSAAFAMVHGAHTVAVSELRKRTKFARAEHDVQVYQDQIAFSPDGSYLAAGDFDKNVILDLERRSQRKPLIDPDFGLAHTQDMNRLEFHPSGALVASGSSDNTVKVWDVAADQLRFKQTVLTTSVVIPAFSPVEPLLAVASSRGTTLYDMLGPEPAMAMQRDTVRGFAFLAGSQAASPRLVTTTLDFYVRGKFATGTISAWEGGSAVPMTKAGFEGDPPEHGREQEESKAIAFDAHPWPPLVAHNGTARVGLYDMEHGKLIAIAGERGTTAFRFSPDGRRLWAIINDLGVQSWSVPDLRVQTRWILEQPAHLQGRTGISCLAAGARWIVAGARSGWVYVLRAGDGQLDRTLKADGAIQYQADAAVQCIGLTRDESRVICGLIDGRMAVFDLRTGLRIAEISAHKDAINAVACHSTTGIVATASRDKTVALWRVDGPTAAELVRIPSPSGRPVLSVRFSPDGRFLGMLVRNERGVRLWDLARLRERLAELGLDWEPGPGKVVRIQ
jgi:serine/threonine protein kinase/WD40 repeat protein